MLEEAKKLLLGVVVEKVLAAAISAVPFLGLPVVNQLFTSLVSWIVGLVFDEATEEATLHFIGIRTVTQNSYYKEAMENLQAVISKPKEEQNPDEIAKAREAFKARARELSRFSRADN